LNTDASAQVVRERETVDEERSKRLVEVDNLALIIIIIVIVYDYY